MSNKETENKFEKELVTGKVKAPTPAPKAESSSAKQAASPANVKRNASAQASTVKVYAERTSPSNHIFIGKKPVMSYAMSSLIQLNASGEIVLKARGMSISRAVDVAEIVCKRLGNNMFAITNVAIDTVKLGEGDEIRSVSTIEIIVGKNK